MQTFSTKAQLKAALLKHHRKHDHVVLVPTMGALHDGHRALLEQARKLAGEDGVVVASIFVNPIQFNNSSDLQTYPRTPEKDLEVCEGAGVDYVFSPSPEEMYSGERSITVEESFLSATLCGASRPGHFSGVCTVLAKLFNLVQPTDAIFGKKDYQQLAIIRRMVRDLNFDIEIIGCPIVREADGLAKSSRNTYLNAEERKAALVLSQAVKLGQKLAADGEASADAITTAMKELIEKEPLARIDYVKAVDAVSVEPVSKMQPPVLVAMAVYIGKTRLIDNFIYEG